MNDKTKGRLTRMLVQLISLCVLLPFAMQARMSWRLMSTDTTRPSRHVDTLPMRRQALEMKKKTSVKTLQWNDLTLRKAESENAVSDVHCLGENFIGTDKDSIRHKSCLFRHLCYDFTQQDFVVTASERFRVLESLSQVNRSFSSTALSPPWVEGKQWFPKRDDSMNMTYYDIPDDIVMVPIFARNPDKILHPIWDVLLPIYTVLSIFHLDEHRIALVDVTPDTKYEKNWIDQFLPLLKTTGPTVYRFRNKTSSVDRICARQATAAMRLLDDVQRPPMRMQGRGRILLDFRQYMLQNIGLTKSARTRLPHKVTLVGSKLANETVSFIRDAFIDDRVEVHRYASFDGLSLKERIKVAVESSVFISDANDENSVFGFFVPRGGSIVLLSEREAPSVEWEYVWSHLSHARVHEIPTNSTNEFLVNLIHEEIRAIRRRSSSRSVKGPVDAFLGDFPLKYVNTTPKSDVNCIDEGDIDGKGQCTAPGEKCSKRVDFSRVCEYRNLCFDTATKQFVLPRSTEQEILEDQITSRMKISSAGNKIAFVGGRNEHDLHSVFNPQPVRPPTGYYELESNVAWLFFNPVITNLGNPGHMMWDTLLPFYAQLSLFKQENSNMALMNINRDCLPKDPEGDGGCSRHLGRYLPLLGTSNYSKPSDLELTKNGESLSGLVCARFGYAGSAMLTDTGFNCHGIRRADYINPHNVNRGRMFWEFRQRMLQNAMKTMGVGRHAGSKKVITFSVNSSSSPNRNRSFQTHMTALSHATQNTDDVSVQSFHFVHLELQDQIQIVSESSIYVSTTGGSTATAMFLPRGSSLILFYNDIDEVRDGRPAYLDYDFWNNASYLRVHWLPVSTMENDVDLFVALVKYELEVQAR